MFLLRYIWLSISSIAVCKLVSGVKLASILSGGSARSPNDSDMVIEKSLDGWFKSKDECACGFERAC